MAHRLCGEAPKLRPAAAVVSHKGHGEVTGQPQKEGIHAQLEARGGRD